MFFFNIESISEIKKDLGLLTRKMRKSAKISQDDLAVKLNLSRITIQNVEAGKNFNIDTLLLIWKHFNELDALSRFLREKIDDYDNFKSLY
jgi:transcriptional regulator with XRE-family HTH domain